MTSENAGGSGSIPNVETIDDKKRIAQLGLNFLKV